MINRRFRISGCLVAAALILAAPYSTDAQISFEEIEPVAGDMLYSLARYLLHTPELIGREDPVPNFLRAAAFDARARQLLADRGGSTVLVVDEIYMPDRSRFTLDRTRLPALAGGVSSRLRVDGHDAQPGLRETAETRGEPRSSRFDFHLHDGSVAAQCEWMQGRRGDPIRCDFSGEFDMVLVMGHPVPAPDGGYVGFALYRDHRNTERPAGSFIAHLIFREGSWQVARLLPPFAA